MSNLSTTITNYLSTSTAIRDAEFVRITIFQPPRPDGTTVAETTYSFSNSYKPETVTDTSGISSSAVATFTPLGGLLTISGHQRDLSATAYDTQITLVGIDQTQISRVLEVGQNSDGSFHSGLKGSQIQIWRGFYDTEYQLLDSPQLRYTGIITSYHISEDRNSDIDTFVLALQASSFKTVLENRFAGRHTNGQSWNTYNGQTVLPDYNTNGIPTNANYDSAMDSVSAIYDVTFNFGLPVTS